MHENEISNLIIGAAIEVHRYYGPGLVEQVYEEALCREFALRSIPFKRQQILPADKAQLRTYLKLSNLRLGIIINFHASVLKDGIVRIVNGLREPELPQPTSFGI
jgi:hypothetical protein